MPGAQNSYVTETQQQQALAPTVVDREIVIDQKLIKKQDEILRLLRECESTLPGEREDNMGLIVTIRRLEKQSKEFTSIADGEKLRQEALGLLEIIKAMADQSQTYSEEAWSLSEEE